MYSQVFSSYYRSGCWQFVVGATCYLVVLFPISADIAFVITVLGVCFFWTGYVTFLLDSYAVDVASVAKKLSESYFSEVSTEESEFSDLSEFSEKSVTYVDDELPPLFY